MPSETAAFLEQEGARDTINVNEIPWAGKELVDVNGQKLGAIVEVFPVHFQRDSNNYTYYRVKTTDGKYYPDVRVKN